MKATIICDSYEYRVKRTVDACKRMALRQENRMYSRFDFLTLLFCNRKQFDYESHFFCDSDILFGNLRYTFSVYKLDWHSLVESKRRKYARDVSGVIADIAAVFKKYKVSIAQMRQDENKEIIPIIY